MEYPKTLSVGRRFQRKIAEEFSTRQAEVEAQKSAAAEDRLRHDLRRLSGLELAAHERPGNRTEITSQLKQSKNVKDRSDLPELDTRHTASLSMKPEPLPSPPLSGIGQVPPTKLGSRYASPQGESELVVQLQINISYQQDHIEKLKEDLQSTRHEVRHLRSERDRVEQEHDQAIQQNDKDIITKHEEHVSRLERQLEKTREKARDLENKVEEGESREWDLRQQLSKVRRENSGLVSEIEVLKSPRSPETLPSSESRPQGNKARRSSSSRGMSKPGKTKYEFSVPKGERRTSATLLKSAISSFA